MGLFNSMASIKRVMKESWIIPEQLSLQERELLFITAEAAGMHIYEPTRNHNSRIGFPYLMFDEEIIHSTSSPREGVNRLSYEEIMEALQQYIKEQSNKMWNEHKQESLDNSRED